MVVWLRHFETGVVMKKRLLILNSDTTLGSFLVPYYTTRYMVTAMPHSEWVSASEWAIDADYVIVGSPYWDENAVSGIDYPYVLERYLTALFGICQRLAQRMVATGRSGTFLCVTTNPSVGLFIPYPTSPILDEAIHSFVRSLSKELASFDIGVFGLCLDPIAECVPDTRLTRWYKKRLSQHGIKKLPIKLADVAGVMDSVLSPGSRPMSGNIIAVGEGSIVGY